MRSTRAGIHFSGSNGPVLSSLLHLLLDCVVCIDVVFGETLNVNSQSCALTDLEALFGTLVHRDQQILNFLVVNLKHGNMHFVFPILIIIA